jgi:hypothetical protein
MDAACGDVMTRSVLNLKEEKNVVWVSECDGTEGRLQLRWCAVALHHAREKSRGIEIESERAGESARERGMTQEHDMVPGHGCQERVAGGREVAGVVWLVPHERSLRRVDSASKGVPSCH